MRKNLLIAAMGAGFFSVAAYADTLLAGMEMQPPDVLSLNGMTVVASASGSLNSLTFDASYNAAVYRGADTFCSGCLTFAYQVTDNSAVGAGTGIIEDITASMFGGFDTDVGYEVLATAQDGFSTGGTLPSTVGRSLAGNGDVVSFDYPNNGVAANNILPGDDTAVLIVETNATNYTSGLVSAIDGATATSAAFEPTSATPEPTSLALCGLGLLGFSLLLKRARRRA